MTIGIVTEILFFLFADKKLRKKNSNETETKLHYWCRLWIADFDDDGLYRHGTRDQDRRLTRKGRLSSGRDEIWCFECGTVTFRDEVMVSTSLISEEELEIKRKQREQTARTPARTEASGQQQNHTNSFAGNKQPTSLPSPSNEQRLIALLAILEWQIQKMDSTQAAKARNHLWEDMKRHGIQSKMASNWYSNPEYWRSNHEQEIADVSKMSTTLPSLKSTERRSSFVRVPRAGTTTKIGNAYWNSDGSYSTRIGNTMWHSDGTSSRRIGKSWFHSDGEISTRIGNTIWNSDGTYSTRIGNTIWNSDGSYSTKIGSTWWHTE